MKKINFLSVFIFTIMFSGIFLSSSALVWLVLYRLLGLSPQYDMVYLVLFMLSLYVFLLMALRIWIKFFPTPVGIVSEDQLWHVHVYQLFYLIFFNPFIKGQFLPIPLLRTLYIILGARMNENSYSGGVIYDAHLVSIGKNCILGENTLLTPHQIEGQKLGYYPIKIGDNVTIGAHAVILPGVTIDDQGIVAANSVVTKGTHILKNEIWAGNPAKKIR